MRLEVLKYLYEMQQACLLLASFLEGKSFEDYESDAMLRSATERQLIILGEALSRLGKVEPSILSSITGFRQIIAFRNILVHGYAMVRNEVVWGILESDLPTLTSEVSSLLRDNAPDEQIGD